MMGDVAAFFLLHPGHQSRASRGCERRMPGAARRPKATIGREKSCNQHGHYRGEELHRGSRAAKTAAANYGDGRETATDDGMVATEVAGGGGTVPPLCLGANGSARARIGGQTGWGRREIERLRASESDDRDVTGPTIRPDYRRLLAPFVDWAAASVYLLLTCIM